MNLLNNILEYYINALMEDHSVTRDEAVQLLDDVLQDSDVEDIIHEIAERY